MLLEVLTYITILSIILLFKSFIDDEEGLTISAVILLIFIFLIGWIGIGHAFEVNSKLIKQKPIEILKGKHTAILTFETKTFILKNYELEKLKDNSTFNFKIRYNVYNGIIDTLLKIN